MSSTEPGLESRIDGLYAGPLNAFVTARNALAKQLREEGDRASAERVRALRKPSMAAWVVNRLALTEEGAFASFLDAAAQVRAAHVEDAASIQPAIRRYRSMLDRLTALASRELAAHGSTATRSTAALVSATFEALAAGSAEGAVPGRLTKPLEAPGFGGLSGLSLQPGPAVATPRSKPDRRPRRSLSREGGGSRSGGGGGTGPPDDDRERAEKRERRREAKAAIQAAEAEVQQAVRARERAERTASRTDRQRSDARALLRTREREAVEAHDALEAARTLEEQKLSALAEARSRLPDLE